MRGDSLASTADLVEELDWGSTPLGARERWSPGLVTFQRLCLESRFPIVLFWGPKFVMIYNDAYRTILGERHPRSLGQPARECWHEIWDEIRPMLEGVLERAESTWSENLMLPLERDGTPEERYFTFSYSPARDGERIAGVFCAVQETTAIVNAAREATERNVALAELDRAKTAFYNNVSHELRTPLTLLLGPAVDRLREERDDPAVRGDLELIVRNGRRLLRLVNTLLDFSRIEANRLALAQTAVDVGALTRDLASMFRSAIDGAGLTLAVATPEGLGLVMLDARLWEHVLYNLLSNALKYTFEGGVTCSVEVSGADLRLIVRDTGVGLPEDEAARVFERFWRSAGQRARSNEGSGIGLAFVAEIARIHDGTVAFESSPGAGSVVTFTIPLIAAGTEYPLERPVATVADQYVAEIDGWAASVPAISEVPARAGAPRLLVVDDNADLRAYMSRVLSEFYDVVVADGGASGTEIAIAMQPDLILCDVMMPDVDGLAFVQALRRIPATAATPVLLVSARAEDGITEAGLQAGADGYLLKPFSSHELLVRVDRELTRVRMREAESQRFRAIADAIVHVVYTHAPDGRVDWTNRRWTDYTRLPAHLALEPEGWARVMPPDDFQQLIEAMDRAFATSTPYELEVRYKPDGAPDSDLRWHLVRAVPMFDDDRHIVRWAGTATDVQARHVADELRTRDIATIAQSVPQIVWTADADGRITFLNDRFEEFTGLSRTDAMQYGWMQVVPDADRALILAQFEFARESGAALNFEHRLWHQSSASYRAVLVRANAVLDARGDVGGWIGTLTDVEDARRTSDRDHHASEAFQFASLPKALPVIPGVAFSAEYHAAEAEALVGGDWYDAFELTDGRIVLSVGDVMGAGLEGAVTMAAARQAIRGAAQIYPDPRAVLDAADRALHSEQPDRIVTAFVAVFEPITGYLTFASAGHPAPMLRRPGGGIIELLDYNLPLGLRSEMGGHGEASQTIHLEPGSLLLLYTDGLTEATRDTALGESRVRSALARASADGNDNVARFIRRDVLDDVPSDDVAILTLAVTERSPEHTARWTLTTTDASLAVGLRRDVAALLRDRGATESEAYDAELILGELLGNVVRHTQGDVDVALDTSGAYPVVHVLDRGRGFTFIARLPQDDMSETGRGLFISAMLARDLTVVRRPDGGSHARAVLPSRLRTAVARSLV